MPAVVQMKIRMAKEEVHASSRNSLLDLVAFKHGE